MWRGSSTAGAAQPFVARHPALDAIFVRPSMPAALHHRRWHVGEITPRHIPAELVAQGFRAFKRELQALLAHAPLTDLCCNGCTSTG
jgi:hypothetical protein